jgi:hypothetical protein
MLITACSKQDLSRNPQNPPVSQPTTENGMFRFSIPVALTGEPYHSSNLTAVVSIAKENGQVVWKDTALNVTTGMPVKTAAIQLPTGDYKLTSLRLVYGSVNTHFAAPVAGSEKASLVPKPLAIDFSVEKTITNEVNVEVIKVIEGDKPAAFGYPVGAFDNGQQENSPFIKVKVKAIMVVGGVTYDSIPASLMLTTYDAQGEMTTTYSPLNAGTNVINLLKSAVRYDMVVSKWGTNNSMTVSRGNVEEGKLFIIAGQKQAKQLKSERTYKLLNGQEIPDTKTDYHYDFSGNLSRIDYWLRKMDTNTPFLAFTDRFEYENGKVAKVTRINEETGSVMRTSDFSYDAQGKVIGISENENSMTAAGSVQYLNSNEVKIHYSYTGRSFDMNYFMLFKNGNLVKSTAATTNNSGETGEYSYDFNINPYRHMNWPDLFLSHSSNSNITSQNKQYSGSYPSAEPYSRIYKYDNDGFPTEVVKNFKSYTSGQFLFSTKTVYVY